jgi:hypothetical protein
MTLGRPLREPQLIAAKNHIRVRRSSWMHCLSMIAGGTPWRVRVAIGESCAAHMASVSIGAHQSHLLTLFHAELVCFLWLYIFTAPDSMRLATT